MNVNQTSVLICERWKPHFRQGLRLTTRAMISVSANQRSRGWLSVNSRPLKNFTTRPIASLQGIWTPHPSWRTAQALLGLAISCALLFVGLRLNRLLPQRRRLVISVIVADAAYGTLGWGLSLALDPLSRSLWFVAPPLVLVQWLIAWFLWTRVNRSVKALEAKTDSHYVGPHTGPGDQPAGWYPDPGGDHENRYWDGHGWTAHVLNGGQSSVSPLPPVG